MEKINVKKLKIVDFLINAAKKFPEIKWEDGVIHSTWIAVSRKDCVYQKVFYEQEDDVSEKIYNYILKLI
jgi:hypothetical protein